MQYLVVIITIVAIAIAIVSQDGYCHRHQQNNEIKIPASAETDPVTIQQNKDFAASVESDPVTI